MNYYVLATCSYKGEDGCLNAEIVRYVSGIHTGWAVEFGGEFSMYELDEKKKPMCMEPEYAVRVAEDLTGRRALCRGGEGKVRAVVVASQKKLTGQPGESVIPYSVYMTVGDAEVRSYAENKK